MKKSSVSFSGCGFLGVYHIGVAACLKKYAPQLLQNKISGASAGSLCAAAVICDGSLGKMMSLFLHFITEAHRRTLGAFCPTFDLDQFLREAADQVLPADAHIRCSGRLVVSVTRVSDGKNIRLSQFDTREELILALLSSSFIPGFSGMLPYTIKGVRYVDGGFTDNQPMVNEDTITVSPFSGEGDICPKDNTPGVLMVSLGNTMVECSARNLYRFTCVVSPPGPSTLSKMCQQGFDDALEFLQRQDLVTCQDCLAMETSISSGRSIRRRQRPKRLMSCSYLDGNYCEPCSKEKQVAVFEKLPLEFGEVVQEAKDKAKDDVMLQLLRYKLLRIIFVLFLPITLPLNVAYMVLFKFNTFTPNINGAIDFCTAIITHLKKILDAVLRVQPSHKMYHTLSKRIKDSDAITISHIEKHNNYHDTDINKISDDSEIANMTSQYTSQYSSQSMPNKTSLKATTLRSSKYHYREDSRIPSICESEDDTVSGPDIASLLGGSPQRILLGEGSTQEAVIAYYVTNQDYDDEVFPAGALSGRLSGGGMAGKSLLPDRI